MPPDDAPRSDKGLDQDRVRVEHMRSAAHDAISIVRVDDATVIAGDMVRLRALVNCFTEIGEAASRVSAGTRARMPAIPWRQVVGMRNLIVHVYWGIDAAQIVKTVRDDLPGLVSSLDDALRTWPR